MKRNYMKKACLAVICALGIGGGGLTAGEESSDDHKNHATSVGTISAWCWTCLNTETSLQWKTVAHNTMSVALDWPENAVKALITGGVADLTVEDVTRMSADVAFSLPTKENQEQIITLAVTYYGADDIVLSTKSAKLALVIGTDGQSVRVKSRTSRVWNHAKSVKPVLPLPEGATALTVNNVPVENFDIPARGWHAVELSGAGSALALTIGETPYAATVYPPKGFCVVIP